MKQPSLDKLRTLAKQRAPHDDAIAEIIVERDRLIREAVYREGATQETAAKAAGVTKGRISQIAPKRAPALVVMRALDDRGDELLDALEEKFQIPGLKRGYDREREYYLPSPEAYVYAIDDWLTIIDPGWSRHIVNRTAAAG